MKLISLIVIMMAALPAYAANRQCPQVDCDCDGVVGAEWQKECRNHEKALIKACVANKGKPTSYCRVQGLDAFPVALSVKPKRHPTVDEAGIEALQEQIKSFVWSVGQDSHAAEVLEKRGDYAQALSQYKSEEKTLGKIHQLHHQIAQSWIALQNPEEALDYWEDVANSGRKNEKGGLADIKALWSIWQSNRVAKDQKRTVQLLAMRRMRNLGNQMERLADAHSRSQQMEKAAEYWQLAADMAEQLAVWKQQVKDKPAFVRYYRNQAAARWNKAALFWRQTEAAEEQADFARNEAERILNGTEQKSIADL
ncbi:hypothetical protein FKG94_25270 [Exilibacterium tricleocarpae]|uniref:Tetratricopeptide repeat protein n=1 Tax=Exilibacterium tricleocarpae TaxID=2591008 RepID=A0A545SRT4_9GAMM|nr:hypothetical protein [Exilibacterium tricleocarpae]TQV67683.1 hypothetical protein FKG94_25270 [Exilibacterium tricleocarpae]